MGFREQPGLPVRKGGAGGSCIDSAPSVRHCVPLRADQLDWSQEGRGDFFFFFQDLFILKASKRGREMVLHPLVHSPAVHKDQAEGRGFPESPV